MPQDGSTTSGTPTDESTTSGTPQDGSTPSEMPTDGSTTSGTPQDVSTTSGTPQDGSTTLGTPQGTTGAPSGSSSKPATCTKEGFMEDPTNCKLFYRCVDNGRGGFTRYQFSCGEGTVWDQSIESCNHPWATDRQCNQKDPNQSTGRPEVSSSAPLESTTSSGTTGDSSATDSPSESGTTSVTNTQVTTTGPPGAESSKNDTKPCDNKTESPQNATISCTADGFYPHPTNCKKFYRCVDQGNGRFSIYHFDCGPGTIFDPALTTCNYESSVYPPRDCSGSTNQATTEAPKPTEETLTTSTEASTTTEAAGSTTSKDAVSFRFLQQDQFSIFLFFRKLLLEFLAKFLKVPQILQLQLRKPQLFLLK